MKHTARSKRLPRPPYLLAMKAYAFAGKPFAYCMTQLSFLALETPRADVPFHQLIRNRLEGLYDGFRREARSISPFRDFSPAQLEVLGIDPLFTWIVEDEDPSASAASAFTQDVIEEMQNFRLRQVVSVLLRLQTAPEEIAATLRKLGLTRWLVEHVVFYNRFFWNVQPMSYEDWLEYIYVSNPYELEREDEDGIRWKANPHASYLRQMVTMESAQQLRFKCALPLEASLDEMDRDLQLNLGCLAMETIRMGDSKNAVKLVGAYTRMGAMNKTSGDSTMDEDYRQVVADLKVVGSPAIAEQLGVTPDQLGHKAPKTVAALQGTVSDPRDTRGDRKVGARNAPADTDTV